MFATTLFSFDRFLVKAIRSKRGKRGEVLAFSAKAWKRFLMTRSVRKLPDDRTAASAQKTRDSVEDNETKKKNPFDLVAERRAARQMGMTRQHQQQRKWKTELKGTGGLYHRQAHDVYRSASSLHFFRNAKDAGRILWCIFFLVLHLCTMHVVIRWYRQVWSFPCAPKTNYLGTIFFVCVFLFLTCDDLFLRFWSFNELHCMTSDNHIQYTFVAKG